MSRGRVVIGAIIVLVAVGLFARPADATWSVVAVDPETGEVGVAVASCVPFEVSIVPVIVPAVGAAASQADISTASGPRFVGALTSGATATDTVDLVVAADDSPEDRQFGVVVLEGGASGWTGSDTFDVALDRTSSDGTAAAQGNIVVSEEVVEAAIAAFESAKGDLADRLLAGLVAGADAGGDARCGDQTATAAALVVAQPHDQNYTYTDAGAAGVDPSTEVVPSVFMSVLVDVGADRAPDRLMDHWNDADRDADTIVIRDIGTGMGAVTTPALATVAILAGVIVLIGVGVLWAYVALRK